MKSSMGPANRVIRAVIGIAIIGAGVYYKNWFGAVGVLLILSALFGCCPLSCCGSKACDTKGPTPKDEHKHGDGCCH